MAKRTKMAQGGRPTRHEGERLSKNRTFRVRGTMDDLLTDAAAKAGRSVSEEIEARLENSLRIDDALGTPEIAAVFHAMAAALATSKAKLGADWSIHYQPKVDVAQALLDALVKIFPNIKWVKFAIKGELGDSITKAYATKQDMEDDQSSA